MRLWRRLQRRGVEFLPADYTAMMRMHGRAGARRQLAVLLAELLMLHPK